ncbi:hypothetical protein [Paenibacillus sp. P46E]|uniref:hypothetical protein n=1 Tax=Paenibacillus sp. P46E TaxID=1349436 RepID=UPI00093F9612|nr:hypothetical protein [Paenibacillus sp. P46E]OKP95397.1 hypothetical protein A3849_26295 [Paenibacillus sp. P46E]
MMLEFKLIDGTFIYAGEDIHNQVNESFNDNRFSSTSLLSVVCVKSKERFIFSMANVIYAKAIEKLPEESPDPGFAYG